MAAKDCKRPSIAPPRDLLRSLRQPGAQRDLWPRNYAVVRLVGTRTLLPHNAQVDSDLDLRPPSSFQNSPTASWRGDDRVATAL